MLTSAMRLLVLCNSLPWDAQGNNLVAYVYMEISYVWV